jgi:5'-3' exonuclease
MGVKKLFTFLNNNNIYKTYSYLNDIIGELEMDKQHLIVGVDANLFCYKYLHSYDNMLIGFFNQVLKFLSNGIIPLYIFDGGTIPEKENTNMLRYQKKIISKHKLEQIEKFEDMMGENNIEISTEDNTKLLLLKKKLEKNSTKINNENILLLLELLELLNIPYMFSHGEGEYLAVLLNKYNVIDFFLTDDTDPIPAGIIKTIKFYNNCVYFLDTKNIYLKLKLSPSEFCDFCILLGSDYNIFSHGLKPNDIYELIKKYKCIENIVANNSLIGLDSSILLVVNRLREIYMYSDQIEKNIFINQTNINNDSNKINLIIDHSNICYYSSILLEYWDDFLNILKQNEPEKIHCQSNTFKYNIYLYVSKSKFNIKNIIRFIKNNIKDITDTELSNAIISFEFLNTFGI